MCHQTVEELLGLEEHLIPKTGLLYVPIANPTPDFNPSTRQNFTNYFTNSITAINITNGKLVWSVPFFGKGNPFGIIGPDTHDDDVAWGAAH